VSADNSDETRETTDEEIREALERVQLTLSVSQPMADVLDAVLAEVARLEAEGEDALDVIGEVTVMEDGNFYTNQWSGASRVRVDATPKMIVHVAALAIQQALRLTREGSERSSRAGLSHEKRLGEMLGVTR
jgi:hypothetical protein